MTIQPIDKASIHRLTSGQVITDLATAVKELVDNALDAKATTVDIRLSDYGSLLVEVSDNGGGIAPLDRPLLARKYYTSKLSSFDELERLTTLGFRGEALSSLCAVSHVSVVTKVAEEACGVKLEYDEHGEISSETMIARAVGTTVSVRDLFHSLPVRRKEFEKNLKRDYGRLVSLLQSYALIRTDVRFVCTNQVGSGARSVVVQSATCGSSRCPVEEALPGRSSGSQTVSQLKASARLILGKKIADGMLAIDKKDDALGVEVFGLVSGAGTGVAKGRADGRHFYVNGRPIEFKKAGKILYESYKNFVSPTHTQRPACVLDVRVCPDRVDVNVTPDKRTVFFHEEAAICRFLQDCLVEAWESERGRYTVGTIVTGVRDARNAQDVGVVGTRSSQLEFSQTVTSLPSSDRQTNNSSVEASLLAASPAVNTIELVETAKVDGRIDRMFAPHAPRTEAPMVCEEASFEKTFHRPNPRVSLPAQSSVPQKRHGDEMVPQRAAIEEDDGNQPPVTARDESTADGGTTANIAAPAVAVATRPAKLPKAATSLLDFALRRDNADYIIHGSRRDLGVDEAKEGNGDDCNVDMDVDMEEGGNTRNDTTLANEGREEEADDQGAQVVEPCKEEETAPPRVSTQVGRNAEREPSHMVTEEEVVIIGETDAALATTMSPQHRVNHGHESERQPDDLTLVIDMEDVRRKFLERTRRAKERQETAAHKSMMFTAASVGRAAAGDGAAGEPEDTKHEDAEEELQRVFQKEQFNEMEVIGQFNMGFIIAKLGDDLFIIDQHASDEKHTFENLQRNTRFHKQRLICPIALEDLTPRDKEIVEENLAVFSNSGFEFEADEEGTLRLISVPHCKGITFSAADVIEMIGMIDRGERSLWYLESSGSNGGPVRHAVYPSRFRALLASKACRTSIMIGKVLTKSKMKEILSNLSTLLPRPDESQGNECSVLNDKFNIN